VNTADFLRRDFAYDEWANGACITAIRAGGADERSLELMAHIIAAERVWLERLQQRPQTTAVWPRRDLAACEEQTRELARLWREYLDGLTHDQLSESISYKNSKGEIWTSTIGDVLRHVVLHSAYHRGQIASHMRANGKTPAHTDYIHGVRQGFFR